MQSTEVCSERCIATILELSKLLITRELFLIVINLLNALPVAHLLKGKGGSLTNRVDVVLHLLVVVGVKCNHKARSEQPQKTEWNNEGCHDYMAHVLVNILIFCFFILVSNYCVVKVF